MRLPQLLERSRRSAFSRWWLNRILPWMIPFNRPHGFEVWPLKEGGIRVNIPYWRVNRNHIKGIHACAIATAAEMCSGLSVLEYLDPKKYRLIMRSLKMEYHFQAKRRAFATCEPTLEHLTDAVIDPLKELAVVEYESSVKVEDIQGNHLATGTIVWQVKEWSRVRTKV